jgi:ATP-dependent protease HslVU (ClpYQ) peptidase subunit
MTLIAAVRLKNEIAVAADSRRAYGNWEVLEPPNLVNEAKLFRAGETWFGNSGSCVYGPIILDWCGHLNRKKRKPKWMKLDSLLAVYKFFLEFRKVMKKKYTMVKDSHGDKDQFASLGDPFLVANPYGIFSVDEDYNVNELRRYWAIGCGAPYAMGVIESRLPYPEDLECGETAREIVCEALHVAARLSAGVNAKGEVEVFKTKKRNGV